MATNTVNQVLQKGKQADEKIAKARQDVAETIENAKKTAEKKREEILDEARQKADELVAKVQLDVDKMYNDAGAEAEKLRADILAGSSGIKSKATEIVSKILF